jgi:hypothetical protein
LREGIEVLEKVDYNLTTLRENKNVSNAWNPCVIKGYKWCMTIFLINISYLFILSNNKKIGRSDYFEKAAGNSLFLT